MERVDYSLWKSTIQSDRFRFGILSVPNCKISGTSESGVALFEAVKPLRPLQIKRTLHELMEQN